MECFWRLFGHWQQDGNCDEQDPSVFYIHFAAHDGFSDHYLHGVSLLAQSPQIYHGREKKSMVLSLSFTITLTWV